MIAFQWIAIPLCALFVIRGLVRFFRGDRHRWGSAVGVVLWAAAGLTIARPEITNVVAGRLGIGRGADLVAYVTALAAIVGFFYFYQRCRRLESDLTQVVRNLAIDDALERWPPGPTGS